MKKNKTKRNYAKLSRPIAGYIFFKVDPALDIYHIKTELYDRISAICNVPFYIGYGYDTIGIHMEMAETHYNTEWFFSCVKQAVMSVI